MFKLAFLVRTSLASLALCVGAAHAQYYVTGQDGGSLELEGCVAMQNFGPGFFATFQEPNAPAENATVAPTALGIAPTFTGEYSELNLLFISFWTYDGQSSPSIGDLDASGSGIRLLFNLLVFGTLETENYTVSFSGAVGECPFATVDSSTRFAPEVPDTAMLDVHRSPERI